MSQDELLAGETAVVDVFSLYRVALGHTPRASALRDSVPIADLVRTAAHRAEATA